MFFDAGNTLLFPDTERTLASLIARGIRPTDDQLRTAEKAVREYRDHHTGHSNPNHSYWNVYFEQLFSTLGLAPDPVLQQQLIASSHRSTNWRRILPDTRNTLLFLNQQYRLAVISNSDGGIQDAISAAGIADCFECIIDSAHVGVEKPDPAIFRAALNAMHVQPSESVYVGDSMPSTCSARVRSACEPSSSIPSAFAITRTARAFRRSPNCLTCCDF